MAIPQVTPLPIAMSRQRPANYSAEGDAYFAALEQKTVPELIAMITAMNTATSTVDTQSTAAIIAAQNAAASQAAAALAANAVGWVSGTTYALNTVVVSQTTFQAYRRKTNAAVSTVDPAADPINWTPVGVGVLGIDLRSSNIQLDKNDAGKIISVSGGNFTQTFSAGSALGNGWYVFYRVSNTANVTLPGVVASDGWMGLLQCNGSSVTVHPFTKPQGYLKISERTAYGVAPSYGTTGNGNATVSRFLNTTESNTIVGATVLSQSVSLPPGTYNVSARAPAYNSSHQLVFGNLIGSTSTSRSTAPVQTDSKLSGQIIVSSQQSFSLTHHVSSSDLSTVYGIPATHSNTSINNVYAELEIWKVA